jgi:anaerobic magnesium-protoporphyrin IX monomethyl ester cyclase
VFITLICADDDTWALGMRSVSSALKAAGHETRMIFAGSVKASLGERIVGAIRSLACDSDIIGISSMSRGSKRAKAILEVMRPLNKVTVWGGMHPTLYPDDCVPHADLICRGEGEHFLVELASRMAAGTGFKDIPNAGFQNDGRVALNDLRGLIGDLGELRFPDFSFENEYVLRGANGDGTLESNAEMREVSNILFSGSRGCLYGCHYCSNSQLKAIYRGKGRYARKMSVPKFIDAAAECKRQFPRARSIYFTDEDFFARSVEEVREFAEGYPAHVGLPFECMASPLQITDEKMELMTKAGMWRIDVGVESGSDRVKRHVFNRPADNEAVMRAAGIVSRYRQVVAYYFFIIGNPYEKRGDLLETICFLRELPTPFFLRAYSLVFIPGTKLFKSACSDGIIAGLEDSGYEIDFLGGLDYRGLGWKKKNLYLNSLIALMAGRFTRGWMGFIPRRLVPFLTAPRIVDYCDRQIGIGKAIVNLGNVGLKLRRIGMTIVSNVVKDRKNGLTRCGANRGLSRSPRTGEPGIFPENIAAALTAAVGFSIASHAFENDDPVEVAEFPRLFAHHPIDAMEDAESTAAELPHSGHEIEALAPALGIKGGPDLGS